jgi:hypothetical protein
MYDIQSDTQSVNFLVAIELGTALEDLVVHLLAQHGDVDDSALLTWHVALSKCDFRIVVLLGTSTHTNS